MGETLVRAAWNGLFNGTLDRDSRMQAADPGKGNPQCCLLMGARQDREGRVAPGAYAVLCARLVTPGEKSTIDDCRHGLTWAAFVHRPHFRVGQRFVSVCLRLFAPSPGVTNRVRFY
jgi:hypothetical protein